MFLARLDPVYKSEATILIQDGESDLTRSTQATPGDASTALDEQAITSQVQLILSRDLAGTVSKKLDLAARPEFNGSKPTLLGGLLAKAGLGRTLSETSLDERVLKTYANLNVYAVDKSRVIGVDFSSTDPKLAADGANAIAEGYITLQVAAKRSTTADAAEWLSTQIADLRTKVTDAESKVEQYRSANDLFSSGAGGATGDSATTLPQQQLADLSAELTKARTERSDAAAKAAQIRQALQSNTVPNLTDVINSQLIQSLVEQQVALRSQIAQMNATYLPQHPKMRELNAQVQGLDRQIASEAGKIVDSLEGEAKLAQAREADINQSLTRLKATASTANDAGVELRALEREAAAQRDLLDSYLRRYREAVAREQTDYLPADARIISRAAVPLDPDFPTKIPMAAAATMAALLLAIAFVLLKELASGRPMRRVTLGEQAVPLVPDAMPVGGHTRWADDHSIRRMMPKEPTLVPELLDRVEESLADIASEIVDSGQKRVLVTLADDSDSDGRPLGAVALSRALARTDARVVLVDFRGDGADAASMGEGSDLPGFSDLFDGEASFAQVIFRDRKSRVHFIPAGRKLLAPGLLDADHLETILAALTLTYDYVLLDANDEMIRTVGEAAGIAMVVSEFGPADPRTVRAFDRVSQASGAKILLLVVDPAEKAGEAKQGAPAGEAA
jgi:uncharacterized protein involved in exopolysaccharide biosynthesis/Mrp family chromosome partitioning ATPase